MKRRKKTEIATGTLRVHPRGFGFIVPQDRKSFPQDIFIPPQAIKGGVDGDLVEVEVNMQKSHPKGPEGIVAKILKRGRSHVAGTIVYVGRKNAIYAHVPLLGEKKTMRILPSKEHQLKPGDRIIIKVLNWNSPLGEICSYIGHIDDPSCDVIAAIEEFELSDAFSEKTIKQAQSFGKKVPSSEIKKREDLRQLECFTIDPETAKDFDDALSIRKDQKGNFHLGVHIADVSYYVKPKSELDKQAKQRCNSVYFPSRVLPMLPSELSNNLCSLKPDVNRLAVSVLMIFDKTGELLQYRITRSVIQSKKRFTYKEAKEVLDGKRKSPFKSKLNLMVSLTRHLKKQRAKRGSIEFALPDISLIVDSKGIPKKIELVEYDITHQLVEEFMLKANEIVAIHLYNQGKPLTYRIHEEPNLENIKEFAALATTLGFKIPSEPTSQELQKLFDELRGSPFGQFLATQFIKSMKLASYSTQNVGHYGLSLEHYTHFTSPIRRYIDLIIHRLLFDEIDPKENLEKIALFCSEKERLSSRAENSVILLKKLRLLLEMQKKNPKRTFSATITSIKPMGFSFALSHFLLEGFIPFFTLNKKRRYFQAGEEIRVKPSVIDLITKEVEWVIA